MAGWLQNIGAFASAGSDALNRYAMLRQQDFENKLKQQMMARQMDNDVLNKQLVQRQIENLDNALLKGHQEDLMSTHIPGADLGDDEISKFKQYGLGGLIGQQQFDMPQQPSGMGGNTASMLDQPDLVSSPTSQTINRSYYMGSPQDIQRDSQMKMLNRAISGLDVNDPKSIALLNMLSGGKLSINDLQQRPAADRPPMTIVGPDGKPHYVTPDSAVAPGALDPTKLGQRAYEKPASPGSQLSDAAIQGMLGYTQQTGLAPSFGMGPGGRNQYWTGVQQQLLNGPNTNGPNGTAPFNFAQQKAIVGADTASARNMAPMVDLIKSFHKAIGSNINVLTNAFDKLNDYGAEALNTPIRELSKKFNDPQGNIAGFEAAALPVLREYARITNNPRLTGQFAFEAQKEVNGMLANGFTAGQFYNVLNVMQQDMNNMEKALGGQLQDIYGRFGSGQGQGTQGPNVIQWEMGPNGPQPAKPKIGGGGF